MTPRDVIEALKRLRFQNGSCAIWIDKQIRDYLVTACPPCARRDLMLALSDGQLAVVMTAARGLPVEMRNVFLERVAARLQLCGSFTDLDFDDEVRLALRRLIQESAA